RAVGRQPVGELRDLAAVLVGRSEILVSERCGVGGAEQFGAGRIGPQNPGAVGRPQPRRQRACRMWGQSRITERSQLEFRMIHRSDWTGMVLVYGRQTMTALTKREYRPRRGAGPRLERGPFRLRHD